MIAIILAGGRGRRMCLHGEKPLLEIGGVKMIDLVADAVRKSLVEEFFVAVSPRTQRTKEYCQERGFGIIETGGRGYHADIAFLLKSYSVFLSLPADTPFVTSSAINDLVRIYDGTSITGCIPLDSVPRGASPSCSFEYEGKLYLAVGVNVVTSSENSKIFVFGNPLLGINVNNTKELKIANRYFRDYVKCSARPR